MVPVVLTTFLSCSDEKDEPAVPAAKTIQGTYAGDLECTVMGSSSIFENKTFTINATDESTVSVVLPAFGEAPMALPSITLTGVKVTEANGVVTLATTEVSGQTDAGKSYTCTFSGDIPILALTAYAYASDEERILASGMNSYMSKPVNAQQLCVQVDSLLNTII